MAWLENAQERGMLRLPIQLHELWIRRRLGHFDYLLSIGQRVVFGAVDTAERKKVGTRHRQWRMALESDGRTAKTDFVDWQITGFGMKIDDGVIGNAELFEFGKLRDGLAAELKGLLDKAARMATTTDTGATQPAPDAAGQESASSAPPPPSSIQQSLAPNVVETTIEERAERRERLLQKYKKATGVRYDVRIYESVEVKVDKADFWRWKHGVVPQDSALAMRIEKFLADAKKPTPLRK